MTLDTNSNIQDLTTAEINEVSGGFFWSMVGYAIGYITQTDSNYYTAHPEALM